MITITRPRWLTRFRHHIRLPQGIRRRLHPYPEQFSEELDLLAYEGKPSIYLVASTPRSGSHFVGHALASGGHYGFPLEYLNQGNLDIWCHRFGVATYEEALTQIMRHRTGPTGLFGLKAHWSQYRHFCTHPMLTGPDGIQRIVWLTRRNRLSQAISFAIANQTGQFISGATRRGKASFDYDAVLRCARNIESQNKNWEEYFRVNVDIPLYHAEFEKLVEDTRIGMMRLASFIDAAGATGVTPADKTQQQSNDTSKVWAQRFNETVRDEDRWVLKPYSPALPAHAFCQDLA